MLFQQWQKTLADHAFKPDSNSRIMARITGPGVDPPQAYAKRTRNVFVGLRFIRLFCRVSPRSAFA